MFQKADKTKLRTKEEVDNLCYLAVLHGMYYTPHKRQAQ